MENSVRPLFPDHLQLIIAKYCQYIQSPRVNILNKYNIHRYWVFYNICLSNHCVSYVVSLGLWELGEIIAC